MIAQLSHSEPFGRPVLLEHRREVRRGPLQELRRSFLPHTSTSSKSSPAARTKTRAVRLLTLGFRMFSVFVGHLLLLHSARRASTCIRCAAGFPTAPGRRASGPPARRAVSRGSPPRARRSARRVRRKLDAHGKRRLLLDARRLRPDEDVAADVGRERAHDLADGRGEDVDAADDQHVVGAPDAAHARAGAAACARARADLDVVARAEAQERRGAVLQMRQHELAGGAVVQLERGAASRDRSARRGRSRARPGASRPAPRTRPRATRRCRRCPSPR